MHPVGANAIKFDGIFIQKESPSFELQNGTKIKTLPIFLLSNIVFRITVLAPAFLKWISALKADPNNFTGSAFFCFSFTFRFWTIQDLQSARTLLKLYHKKTLIEEQNCFFSELISGNGFRYPCNVSKSLKNYWSHRKWRVNPAEWHLSSQACWSVCSYDWMDVKLFSIFTDKA